MAPWGTPDITQDQDEWVPRTITLFAVIQKASKPTQL